MITDILSPFFKGLGSQEDAEDGLEIGGDIVRYLFSIFPQFNLANSFIVVGQSQASNNLCINNIDKETLTLVCTELSQGIATESSGMFIVCCGEPYVDDPKLQLCEIADMCWEIKSFFTWDELNGLNINLMWMIGTTIFFIVILVFIETGLLKRILSGKTSRVRFFFCKIF